MMDKARILVVDDEPAIRRIIRVALDPAYEVLEAGDGVEGLAEATAQHPDLILLDLQMPSMHGLAVLAKLKADQRTSEIPVIIVSVKADTEALIEGQRQGALDYVIKPFDIEQLRKTVTRNLVR